MTLTQDFRSLPPLSIQKTGYGAGSTNPPGWPNALRVLVSTNVSSQHSSSETVIEIQTTLDDLNPQLYEPVIDRLFDEGALDVTLTPVIMKRSRPGIIMSVLTREQTRESIVQTLFRETTTLGLRVQILDRYVLPRKMENLKLPAGNIRIKIAEFGDGEEKMIPEYRDCLAMAKKTGAPVREIIEEAFQVFRRQHRAKAKRR